MHTVKGSGGGTSTVPNKVETQILQVRVGYVEYVRFHQKAEILAEAYFEGPSLS